MLSLHGREKSHGKTVNDEIEKVLVSSLRCDCEYVCGCCKQLGVIAWGSTSNPTHIGAQILIRLMVPRKAATEQSLLIK